MEQERKRQIVVGVRKKENVSTEIILEDISGDTRKDIQAALPTGAHVQNM